MYGNNYTSLINVDLAQQETFCAKVGKSGIIWVIEKQPQFSLHRPIRSL